MEKLKRIWQGIRRLSGDDAYEQYLSHYEAHHAPGCSKTPLTREVFFKEWQDNKWKGIKRCC